MKNLMLLFFIFLLFTKLSIAQVVIRVIDSNQHVPLAGAEVYDTNKKILLGFTDDNGIFYIKNTHKPLILKIEMLGYKSKIVEIDNENRQNNIIILSPLNFNLMPVIVSSDNTENYLKNNKIGEIRIRPKLILSKPGFMGENDAFKILQIFSGVSFSTELSSNYIVRGSSPSENLILIDDIPVFNINHFGGFVSVLPGDYIKEMKFYKSYIPAEYSARSASVLDIKISDGKLDKHHIKFSLSTIAMNFSANGPISKKHKLSYFIGFRRSFLGELTGIFYKSTNESKSVYFNDIFLKASKHLKKGKIDLIYLHTTDYAQIKRTKDLFASDDSVKNFFSVKDKYGLQWGNNLFGYKWSQRITDFWYTKVIVYSSDYSFKYFIDYYKNYFYSNPEALIQDTIDFKMNFGNFIRDISFRNYNNLVINNKINLKFGIKYNFLALSPNKYFYYYNEKFYYDSVLVKSKFKNETNDTIYHQKQVNSYFSINYRDKRFNIWTGLVLDIFDFNKIYIEPRLALNFYPFQNYSVKLAAVNTIQNEHQIVPTFFDLPIDYWVFSDNYIPPINAWHYSLGLYYGKEKLKLYTEIFYKKEKNIIKILPGESFLDFEKTWYEKVDIGSGKSYGIETGLMFSSKKLYVNINFSHYPSFREFSKINEGRIFIYKYDRTNFVKLYSILKLNQKLSLSANWIFTGGYWATVSKYIVPVFADYYNLVHGGLPSMNLQTYGYPNYTELNNYRLPNYHRLDVNLTYNKTKSKYKFEFNFGIYNVYNHYNIFGIYVVDGKYFSYSLFNFLPYIKVQFTF